MGVCVDFLTYIQQNACNIHIFFLETFLSFVGKHHFIHLGEGEGEGGKKAKFKQVFPLFAFVQDYCIIISFASICSKHRDQIICAIY